MKRNTLILLIILVGLGLHTTFFEKDAPVREESGKVKNLEDSLYKVIGVTDGDTATIAVHGVNEKVRFIGIDTPEVDASRGAVECYGKEASDKTKELLTGAQVRIEIDPTQGERDTYGRLLAYVFLEDGTNVNQLLLKEGFAKEYTYNKVYKYQDEFRQAEAEARIAERGLWSNTNCP